MKARKTFLFCLLAGGGDAATGLLLVTAPGLVLRLLGVVHPAGDLTYLRFAGVFVGCVGLAYLYPWVLSGVRRNGRVAAAVEMTAGVRLAVALFVGLAVAGNQLELPWVKVGVYDAVLATAQFGLLARGFFSHAA